MLSAASLVAQRVLKSGQWDRVWLGAADKPTAGSAKGAQTGAAQGTRNREGVWN